ncbi:type III secretion protein, partial [Pseudomonas sp. K5002]|nr:type III secretion protein [Pseudomonas sp. K5002]
FVAPKGYSGRLPRDLEIVQTVAARLLAEELAHE